MSRRNSRPVRKVARRRAAGRRPFSLEPLESRQLLTAGSDDLASLSDEFQDSATLGQWSRVEQVEGWNVDQLQVWDINASQADRMVMQPHTVVWYQDWRGPMVFKELSGDFVFTTEVHIADRDDVGDSDLDDVPDDAQYSLGGVMVRTPRAITNPALDWQPGTQLDDGTNQGENYAFLSLGHGVNGQFNLEVKTTRNSDSQLHLTTVDSGTATLQVARVGQDLFLLYRLPGQDWVVHERYHRPDMPDTIQVGLVTYTNWEKASDFDPFFHNGHVLQPGVADPTPGEPFNPDLVASFEFARFARPEVPAALAGLDLRTQASDAQLLTFLGDVPNQPAAPPVPDPEPALPTVRVEPLAGLLQESAGAGQTAFRVLRAGPLAEALDVAFAWEGDALLGQDFAAAGGLLHFAAGQDELLLTLDVLDDDQLEGHETIRLTLLDGTLYDLAAAHVAERVLADNDFPQVADQAISPNHGPIVIALPTATPNGTPLSYGAEVEGDLASQLNAEYELASAGSYHLNWGGQQEKWLTGTGGWYYLLADGSLWRWQGSFAASTLLAQLDAAHYEQPELLHEAEPNATVAVSGGQLTVTPRAGYTGAIQVRLTADNGIVSQQQTFEIQVENHGPELAAVPDAIVSRAAGSLSLPLDASDADGDALTLTARVVLSPAAELDAAHLLVSGASYHTNWGGQQEKWLTGVNGWYYLLPSGDLYQWQGSFGASTLLGSLGSEVYDDPTLLTDPDLPPVTAGVVAGEVVVSWQAAFAGTVTIEVRASDGLAETARQFQVTVTNHAPELAEIPDQTLPLGGQLAWPLVASDVDGDSLSFSVEVIQSLEYQLDQQYGFHSGGNFYTNWGGQQEKWILDSANRWHYLLADGSLYRWEGSFGGSVLVAALDPEVYADPLRLTEAPQAALTANVVDGVLLIDTAGFQGLVRIRVRVSDGSASAEREFALQVG